MIQLKFENLKEIHGFLYSSKPQKLKQKEINNSSQFIINEETKKYNKMPYNGGLGSPDHGRFTTEFHKT